MLFDPFAGYTRDQYNSIDAAFSNGGDHTSNDTPTWPDIEGKLAEYYQAKLPYSKAVVALHTLYSDHIGWLDYDRLSTIWVRLVGGKSKTDDFSSREDPTFDHWLSVEVPPLVPLLGEFLTTT